MKKHTNLLLWLLAVTSVLVALAGAVLKYGVFAPLGVRTDGNIMEVPFLLLADDGLQFTLRYSYEKSKAPAETEPPATVPAETREPATEAVIEETQPVETEPPVIEVEESWFDDALFIGDSRMVGLQRHGRLGEADYFCAIGMSYFNLKDFHCKDTSFYWGTNLDYLLKTRTYGKVYIALGMNGSGNPLDMTGVIVDETIQKIREYQPDAKIILHAIIGVGPTKEASAWYFENDILYAINEVYASKADGETVFYIDPNDWMTDEEGHLLSDYCDEDQCHLTVYGYESWAAWILDTAGSLGIS